MFCTCSPLFMRIRVEKMLKLTNLTNRMNNQFHVQKVKIGPKTEILNMKKHVSIQDEIYFMRFRSKCVNAIQSEWVGLVGVRWVKSFEVWKRMPWVEKESESKWNVLVFTLIKVLSLEKPRWNGKAYKFEAKSSFLTKSQVSSHS